MSPVVYPTAIDQYVAQLQRLLGRGAAGESVIREVRDHLTDKVASLIRDGRTPEEAAREAVASFGDAREFAIATLVSGRLDPAPPTVLRWIMFGASVLTGLLAGTLLIAIAVTALAGSGGQSILTLVVVVGAAAATLLHAVAFGRLLLCRADRWPIRTGVFLGGICLLAVSGAAVLGSALDDSPGGTLLGLLLAVQGAGAVATVAFPRIAPQYALPGIRT